MNLEQRSDPGLVDYSYSHYPEIDHVPAFAWSGQESVGNGPPHFSDDEEQLGNRKFSEGEDESNTWEYQRSMTR
jgi:hypothetical protein